MSNKEKNSICLPICPFCNCKMELDRVTDKDFTPTCIYTYWMCDCDDDVLFSHNDEVDKAMVG